MGQSLTIRLIRAVILVVIMSTLAACSSMQKPSIPQEQQVVSTVSALSIQEKQQVLDFQKEAEESSGTNKQPVQEVQEASPNPDAALIKRLSDSFKLSPETSEKMIKLAKDNAYEDFPSRDEILAVIAVESGFQPKVSYRGSHGLMQIEMKSHKDKLHGRSIFDPNANVEIGAFVLNQCYELLGKNKRGALLAYNSGIGNYLKKHYREEYYLKVMVKLKFISQP